MKKVILVFAAIAITAGGYAQTDLTDRKLSSRDINQNQYQHTQNYRVDKSVTDGVLMQKGKIMMVKNGKMIVLDHDMTMNNGTKILVDGTIIDKDGTRIMIKEGQHIDMAGNITFVKTKKDKNMYLVPDSLKNKDF